ncbi:MAG: hypothetical protein JAY74_17960 [Candidatus Thiodiazotropha taylori]|nr:hypothetical protein [Candidatus Thiodiazotropha taylori]
MARFRSKEARVQELEDRKSWANDPNYDWKSLERDEFREYLGYKLTGRLGTVLSEDMSIEDLKEAISLLEAGEEEQAQSILSQLVVSKEERLKV